MLSVLFCLNDLVKAHAEYLRKAFEFNVHNEPFSAFYPLYGIFIEINPKEYRERYAPKDSVELVGTEGGGSLRDPEYTLVRVMTKKE